MRDLPLAVKNIIAEKNWLNPYNAKFVEQLDDGYISITEKLVPYFDLKKDYVIHYQELQYYIKLGIVVDKDSYHN